MGHTGKLGFYPLEDRGSENQKTKHGLWCAYRDPSAGVQARRLVEQHKEKEKSELLTTRTESKINEQKTSAGLCDRRAGRWSRSRGRRHSVSNLGDECALRWDGDVKRSLLCTLG